MVNYRIKWNCSFDKSAESLGLLTISQYAVWNSASLDWTQPILQEKFWMNENEHFSWSLILNEWEYAYSVLLRFSWSLILNEWERVVFCCAFPEASLQSFQCSAFSWNSPFQRRLNVFTKPDLIIFKHELLRCPNECPMGWLTVWQTDIPRPPLESSNLNGEGVVHCCTLSLWYLGAETDDQHRNPNINNNDYLVGKEGLTMTTTKTTMTMTMTTTLTFYFQHIF